MIIAVSLPVESCITVNETDGASDATGFLMSSRSNIEGFNEEEEVEEEVEVEWRGDGGGMEEEAEEEWRMNGGGRGGGRRGGV